MTKPLEWSLTMDDLFRTCVVRPVLDDPRTDLEEEDLRLGFPFDIIRERILEKGRADFGQGYEGKLTPEEKVLLYCFVNLKKHFYACSAVFQSQAAIKEVMSSNAIALVIDVGCGPATACLALADTFPGRQIEYFGIDSAKAMQTKAKELWEAAFARALMADGSRASFLNSWELLDVAKLPGSGPMLVLFSYFFASPTLTWSDLKSLALFVETLVKHRQGEIFLLVYLNSTNELANRNYEVFKQLMGLKPEMSAVQRMEIEYVRRKNGPPGADSFLYELLQLPGSVPCPS